MKILKEIKQPLLSRTKYEVELDHNNEKTPAKKDLTDNVSSFLKNDKELVVIDKIITKLGSSQSKLIVYVYDDKKSLENLKLKKKHGKKKNKEQSSK
ncbi:MAG: hypothetical protein ISS82_03905 [Nanoarchaeota archaeon]|nr:hypothetical protein [Nanoarchaeota archaeon]